MKLSTQQKSIGSSKSLRMVCKLSALVILLISCYTLVSTHNTVPRVRIPDGCASACPPQRDQSRFICARSTITRQLGMFPSECVFGRYNHCIYVNERK